MNKRRMILNMGELPGRWALALTVCGAAFLMGAVAGTVASGAFCQSGGAGEYAAGYISALRAGGAPELWRLYLEASKFHILAFLLGFSMLGALGVPVLTALRGFSLSFTLAVLVRLYGLRGAAAGLALFGGGAILAVPAYFALAVQSMCASLELIWAATGRDRGPGIYSGAYFLRAFAAALLLLILTIGERAILASGAAGLLP